MADTATYDYEVVSKATASNRFRAMFGTRRIRAACRREAWERLEDETDYPREWFVMANVNPGFPSHFKPPTNSED